VAGVFALAAVVSVAVLTWIAVSPSPQPESGPPSITVLRFTVRGEPDAQELADGVAEELTRALGKLDLRVISHASAAALGDRGLSPTAIGDSLSVRYVVEGQLRKEGSRLRVSVNLTDARDGTVLWSQQFERPLLVDQMWRIEDEAVRAIADSLGVTLSLMGRGTLVARPAATLEAYRLYLRGRHFWDRRNLEGAQTAIERFQQAIARDPGYALAYVGLVDAYTTSASGTWATSMPGSTSRWPARPRSGPSCSTAAWRKRTPRWDPSVC
jgi:TolB-like protein